MRSQSCSEIYRQLRNAKSGRNSLPQGIAQQLVIQYHVGRPENTRTSLLSIFLKQYIPSLKGLGC